MRDLSRVSKLFRVSCGVLKRKTAKTEKLRNYLPAAYALTWSWGPRMSEEQDIQEQWRNRRTELWICGLLSLLWLKPLDDAFTGLVKVLLGGVFIVGMSSIVILSALPSDQLPSWPKTLVVVGVCFLLISGISGHFAP